MFLSRSGLELNEIWYQQANMLEADERIRSLERKHHANPADEGTREAYIRALRQRGDHDSADAVLLRPHAQRFADAVQRVSAASKKRDDHIDAGADPHTLGKLDDAHDKAMHDAGSAHGVYTHFVSKALHERGDGNPLHNVDNASLRQRIIHAHGSKHLPKTDNWGDEHRLLSGYHGMWKLGGNHEHPRGVPHMFVGETAAQRHAMVHSLVTRNPHLTIHHGWNDQDGTHHVLVYTGEHDSEPRHRDGGSITGPLGHHTTKEYLEKHPPHEPIKEE